MSNPLRDFLRTHPSVIAAGEGFEHVILDALEGFIVDTVSSRLGIIAKVLPVQSLADTGKAAAERFIDGQIAGMVGDDGGSPATAPALATTAAAPAAPAAKPAAELPPLPSDPYARAKMQAARARIDAAATVNAGDRNAQSASAIANATGNI